MQRTIFDLLSKEIDYEEEFMKIYDLFFNKTSLNYKGYSESYKDVFNSLIIHWKYRRSYTNLDEIYNALDIESYEYTSVEQILYLCELILNVREFLEYIKNNYQERIIFLDEMLIGNIKFILSELGYTPIKKDEYKINLIKNDADAINAAQIVKEDSLADLILNYNDFKIAKNVEAKRNILVEMGKYFEAERNNLKGINKDLEQNIFAALNNLHIRHNNINGKDKKEYTAKLSDEQFIEWYDQTYSLLLIAFRLLNLDELQKDFKKLREEYLI